MKAYKFLLVFIVLVAASSCSKNKDIKLEGDKAVMDYVNFFMGEIYYWNTQAPKPDLNNYDNVFDFFSNSLVKQDRWSWMETGEDYMRQETGIYTSYGFNIRQNLEYYNDYALSVAFVYPNSPFDKAGITRGCQILKINGETTNDLIRAKRFNTEIDKSNNIFTIKDLTGNIKDISLSKSSIATRSVLISEVYTNKDFSGLSSAVGYINYLTFNANMMDDINSAIAKMKAANVKNLILDLRYNGGGDSRPTALLANLLANKDCDGKVLVKRKHNSKYSSWDSDSKNIATIQRTSESLDLARLYIISGYGTASASEVIINGLRPMMEVVMVGDTTYGKPNGMYVQTYPQSNYTNPDYVFLPICFYNVNMNNEGDFDNGLIPNNYRPDDLYHNWGPEEDLIKSCLTHIVTGSFPPLPLAAHNNVKNLDNSYILKIEENELSYGRYVVIP